MLAEVLGYGPVEFDFEKGMQNEYDLWCVCICDPDPDSTQVIEEEHYTSRERYVEALGVDGRELMNTMDDFGWCDVRVAGDTYECPACYHFAYVVDEG